MSWKSGTERALALIRTLPRVAISNVRPDVPKKKAPQPRGFVHGGRRGFPQKGAKQHQTFQRLGFQGGGVPFYLRIPKENYYSGHHLRRQYPPVSLLRLQLLIDTNRINPNEPIDLAALCNTKVVDFAPQSRHFGFHLTDEGIDRFKAKINIEVQWATEHVIAAVEKNGGTITTAYYDLDSLWALKDPKKFFLRGVPIMRRMLPPEDAIEYYTDPKFRGYLADPEKVAYERLVLAQKYGYELPDLSADPQKDMLLKRKDPRQVFFGLQPGWVVNLRDKCVMKPKDPKLVEYYNS